MFFIQEIMFESDFCFYNLSFKLVKKYMFSFLIILLFIIFISFIFNYAGF